MRWRAERSECITYPHGYRHMAEEVRGIMDLDDIRIFRFSGALGVRKGTLSLSTAAGVIKCERSLTGWTN